MSLATVYVGCRTLLAADVAAVATGAATAVLDSAARDRIAKSYAFMQELAAREVPVYGLTTGCGPLANNPIPAERRPEFQRNLIRSHAVGLGDPLPTAFVRAAMATRAHVLSQGYSAVAPNTIDVLIAMLNESVHPVVREVGSVGASGDLVELAQIAHAVIGEGEVEWGGRVVSAAQGLAQAGVQPLQPRFREGLALINGTSFHTGVSAVLITRAERILCSAQIAAAMMFDGLAGNLEAYDPALHRARPHPGQLSVAERVTHMVAGSALGRHAGATASSQDAYTLRCIPQVLGAVVDGLRNARSVVETELNSISDNPIFLANEGRVVHGGNFHGQPVAMALDQLKAVMVELGVISERRIARALDAKLNGGLPPFLIRDGAGLRSGLMGLQYCASSMTADNAVLAAPASVHSVSTNANNQDVVSMGTVAARQAARVIDNVARTVAIELLCAAQLLDLRGAAQAGVGTRAAHATIRTQVAPLIEDRPLRQDVEAICRLIESGELARAVDAALAESS